MIHRPTHPLLHPPGGFIARWIKQPLPSPPLVDLHQMHGAVAKGFQQRQDLVLEKRTKRLDLNSNQRAEPGLHPLFYHRGPLETSKRVLGHSDRRPNLVRGGSLFRVLVCSLSKQPRKSDADAAVLLELAYRCLVDGRLGQIGALHLPNLPRQKTNRETYRRRRERGGGWFDVCLPLTNRSIFPLKPTQANKKMEAKKAEGGGSCF